MWSCRSVVEKAGVINTLFNVFFAFFTLKGLTVLRLSHIILISKGDIMNSHEVFKEFFYLVCTEPAS